jgi:hypothetical protein
MDFVQPCQCGDIVARWPPGAIVPFLCLTAPSLCSSEINVRLFGLFPSAIESLMVLGDHFPISLELLARR